MIPSVMKSELRKGLEQHLSRSSAAGRVESKRKKGSSGSRRRLSTRAKG